MIGHYFTDLDGNNEPTMWEWHDDMLEPQPILSRYDVNHPYRDRMWPLIVDAMSTAVCDCTTPRQDTES